MGDAYACVMDARMLLLFLWCVRKDQRKLQLQRTEASVFYSAGVFSMGGQQHRASHMLCCSLLGVFGGGDTLGRLD